MLPPSVGVPVSILRTHGRELVRASESPELCASCTRKVLDVKHLLMHCLLFVNECGEMATGWLRAVSAIDGFQTRYDSGQRFALCSCTQRAAVLWRW